MKLELYGMRLGVAISAALALAACQNSPNLDELPAGSRVTIEMQDGRLVSGTLVSVAPDDVVLTSEADDTRVRVVRTGIAEVLSEDAETPEVVPVTVPSGTKVAATLDTAIASNASSVEDPVQATLTDAIVIDGVTIAPSGSVLLGAVTAATPSGKVQGRASLGVRFTQLRTDAVTYDIRTAPLTWVAEATKGEDAAKIGIGAAIGAVIGGVAGGGKGAAIGSAVGAGGGTAVVLATPGEDIRIAAGSAVQVELTSSLTVRAPRSGE